MRRTAATAVAAVMVVAACGGKSVERVAERATTTTVTGAEVASVVAELGPPMRAQVAYEERCSTIDCLAAAARIDRYRAITAAAAVFRSRLAVYEHRSPSDMAGLVERTLEALRQVTVSGGDFSLCVRRNAGGSIEACSAQASAFEGALRATPPILDAWAPYMNDRPR